MAACQQSSPSAIMILRVSSWHPEYFFDEKNWLNHVQISGNVAGGYLNVNPPQDDSSVSVNQNGVQGI